MADHPDFSHAWCTKLLSDPDIQLSQVLSRQFSDRTVSNSIFETTLSNDRAVRARVDFRRPCREADAVRETEDCSLLSIGDGLDGKSGRAHGGFNALVLDQVSGACAHRTVYSPIPPATATMTVDYKAPIDTPGVVLARAWLIELTGRKIWIRAVIENGEGMVLASAKALFVAARMATL